MDGVDNHAALAETHVSVVAFIGDRAYKLKKPVAMGFLDFSTREAAACHREVELNRRLAPDVCLGVADVRGPDGRACAHLVVMRRMPAAWRLATLIRGGADVSDGVRQLARLVAGFHQRVPTSPAIASAGALETVLRHWEPWSLNDSERRRWPSSSWVGTGSSEDGAGRRSAGHRKEPPWPRLSPTPRGGAFCVPTRSAVTSGATWALLPTPRAATATKALP